MMRIDLYAGDFADISDIPAPVPRQPLRLAAPSAAVVRPGALATLTKRAMLPLRHIMGYRLIDRLIGLANIREA